jgi:hypothetical protein
VASLSYPDGAVVAYAPNALGEPTQVSGYASGVSFHPNGAIAGYMLANGIAHSTTQTARGLPSTAMTPMPTWSASPISRKACLLVRWATTGSTG